MHSEQDLTLPSTSKNYEKYSFRFHGSASEYFGVWLANIVLTVLSLTLYTPWAKARRLRYFYGNTEFIQRRFDFTGLPSKILLGRIFALELYLVFLVLTNYSVTISSLSFLLLYLVMPWLFRLTIKFRSRNTKFANTRFYFFGQNRYLYRELTIALVKTLLSLFILLPKLVWLYQHYCFDHLQIGQLKFKFTAPASAYMKAFYVPIFISWSVLFIGIWMMSWEIFDGQLKYLLLIPALSITAVWLLVLPIILARFYILTWNHLHLGDGYFKTRANPWRYAWIVLSNWLVKLFSLGLLSAWAEVRLYHYKLSQLDFYSRDDPRNLSNILQPDQHSIGQELSQLFDFDASL